MSKSKISWTDQTWNPVVGCSKVSPGCDNCYAERMACRLASMKGQTKYFLVTNGFKYWNHKTFCDESALEKPLHWRKPRRIFVCSMGDLFHESVPFEFIDKVLAIIRSCPQHEFQILTKRAEAMWKHFDRLNQDTQYRSDALDMDVIAVDEEWPLPNLWLGVTAENQEQADKRIPLLLQIPAAKRFVSCEPMLGEIDLGSYCKLGFGNKPENCSVSVTKCGECNTYPCKVKCKTFPWLDLVICGGESGPGARPMHPDWARGLRDQCKAAGVAFHFKQWGEWAPCRKGSCLFCEDSKPHIWEEAPNKRCSIRVGKKLAGHLLDGVEHRPQL